MDHYDNVISKYKFTIVNDPSSHRSLDRYIRIENCDNLIITLFGRKQNHSYYTDVLYIGLKKIKDSPYIVYQKRTERYESFIYEARSFILGNGEYQYLKYLMLG